MKHVKDREKENHFLHSNLPPVLVAGVRQALWYGSTGQDNVLYEPIPFASNEFQHRSRHFR